MSKIALKPNESGTGVFTLAAPDSNADRTLTLPDEAGKVLTDVSDIEPQVKTATNATGSAPVFACRAWVNFDGFNTTIRDSGNVSSITDNGTGDYTVNFATAMPDSNYCVSGTSQRDQVTSSFGNASETVVVIPKGVTNPLTPNSARIRPINFINETYNDSIIMTISVFR